MLTLSWDFARQLWQGKRIIIQAGGSIAVAWSGTISRSYYEPVGLPLLKPDYYDLRIVYQDVYTTKEFPNHHLPLGEWECCVDGPHLIVPSRVTDLYVTEDDESGIPGGDLWCMFEIPEIHRAHDALWYSGYFLIQMEEKRMQVLAAAKQQRIMRFRRF